MKNDILMYSAIAEAMDECGLYDEKLEQTLLARARELRDKERFIELDYTSYEEFLFALLATL